MEYRYEINTPLGIITLIEKLKKISHICYGVKQEFLQIRIQKTPLLELTEIQLLEYFLKEKDKIFYCLYCWKEQHFSDKGMGSITKYSLWKNKNLWTNCKRNWF